MIGMDATTGKPLSGIAHLAQSIARILSTPLGSVPMARDFGSLLFDLIDRPINASLTMLLHAATATALRRWEPRIALTRVVLSAVNAATGEITIAIQGKLVRQTTAAVNDNEIVSLSIPLLLRRAAA